MTKDEILVIQCKCALKQEDMEKARRSVLRQMEDGVVILPPWMEPMIVPAGLEVRIKEAADGAV